MEEEVSLSQWKRFFWIILPLLAPEILCAQDVGSRYELGGLIHYSFLREIGSTDSRVGTEIAGFGGRLVYRALPLLDVESEIDFSPGNSATSGHHLQALFGVKAGKRWEKAGVFLKARPGFIHFSRDPFGVGKPGSSVFSHERASSTEPNIDVGAVIEYYTVRGVTLRFDLGDSIIRYARRTVRASEFLPTFEAGGFTTHNWRGSFGIGFRF